MYHIYVFHQKIPKMVITSTLVILITQAPFSNSGSWQKRDNKCRSVSYFNFLFPFLFQPLQFLRFFSDFFPSGLIKTWHMLTTKHLLPHLKEGGRIEEKINLLNCSFSSEQANCNK